MLLDTHVLLWLLADDHRLGAQARARVRQISAAARVLVSTASLWELAIKSELGKIEISADLPSLVEEAGLTWLPVSDRHAWESRLITGLPHRDPFDRFIVTQAAVEGLALLTADRALLGSTTVPAVEMVDARR